VHQCAPDANHGHAINDLIATIRAGSASGAKHLSGQKLCGIRINGID
jgi:hypothetical protein